jgi:hypothetical protein
VPSARNGGYAALSRSGQCADAVRILDRAAARLLAA